MLKHLTAHGNSAAIVIDKPILEILKIDMKTPLEITTDGRNLIISPVHDKNREKIFRSALSKVIKEHGETFRKLAK
jgi:antitoxin component of MazEF toxin-antitoxin module